MIRLLIFCLLVLIPQTAQGVTLEILEWEGYISPYAREFENWAKKEKGIDVTLHFIQPYATNPEQIFKIARSEKADIITPTHNYYKMHKAKLIKTLLPLNTAMLVNYRDILQSLRNATYDKMDGRKYSVPLLGGSYGLAYNRSRTDSPTTWKVLWDATNKGQFSITDDQFEANIYLCMLMAGYSPETFYDIDATDFDQPLVQTYLNKLVANAHSFWPGMTQPETMRSLKFTTTYWIGVAAANHQGQDWHLATPREGQTVWLDTMALSRHLEGNHDKLQAAYLLLDFMISPQIQKRIHDAYGSIIVNTEAAKLMTPEEVAEGRIGDETFFQEKWFWQPLSSRTRNMYKLMWEKAKQNAGRR